MITMYNVTELYVICWITLKAVPVVRSDNSQATGTLQVCKISLSYFLYELLADCNIICRKYVDPTCLQECSAARLR